MGKVAKSKWELYTKVTKEPVSGRGYYCQDCKREVAYPEAIYNDNRCEQCHTYSERRPV